MEGQVFGSTWEANVYQVLTERKLGFSYQVPELGGWVPGGTIIDFVVYKPGALQEIALYVDGPRWHSGQKAPYELQKRKRLEQYGYKVLVIGDESETVEGARAWIKENI